jgi:hypothetical protein
MKKIAVSPSLTHGRNGLAMARPPTWTATEDSEAAV